MDVWPRSPYCTGQSWQMWEKLLSLSNCNLAVTQCQRHNWRHWNRSWAWEENLWLEVIDAERDLSVSLLLLSHPKAFPPTNPKQQLQCGIGKYLLLCMWFLWVHAVSITKLFPGKLPCRRLFPSCSDELEEWASCRDRKSSQAKKAKSETDFSVSCVQSYLVCLLRKVHC